MNLGEYTEVLTKAEAEAVRFKDSRVVVYWPAMDSFSQYFMSVHVQSEGFDSRAKIAAYVDHEGIITESRWIKEQLGLAEVAA
jgi:hypothetical protein